MCLSLKISRPKDVLGEGEHAGYQWAIVHNGMGYRCGYVRIPKGHPWHGKDYDNITADVHGGLTFAEPDMLCDKGGDDDAWWIGFDCAHSYDAPDHKLPDTIGPRFDFDGRMGTVRTQEYVEAQCRKLCEQVKEAA